LKALENPDVFLELMRRYEQPLLRYIQRIINVSVADAEDILQDVFIKSYENLNAFNIKLKFSSWMYRIAHNQSISYYRKNKRKIEQTHPADADELLITIASDLDIHREITQKEHDATIHRQIKKLPKKYKEVLILKYLEEKDYKEISDILHIPMGTVATLINRAKKQLKTIVSEHDLTY
jgi:RNA polymerase sigma-70 factor (ECF subfamily)